MKTIILHYHLFKNAGTSLDAALKENFDEGTGEWVTKEFSGNLEKNRAEVKQWIIDNPQAKCFSSHTAVFPIPEIDGIKIIPVIFVRHPIDRIVSAYTFEHNQGSKNFWPTLARNTTLAGYIETRLAFSADRQCRNFHSHRLSTMFSEKKIEEAIKTEMAIKALPFVGLVEKYSESLERLEKLLALEGFGSIKLKPVEKNVSRGAKKSLEEKLMDIKEQLGNELYAELTQANSVDLTCWKQLNND